MAMMSRGSVAAAVILVTTILSLLHTQVVSSAVCDCTVTDRCDYLKLQCQNGGTFSTNYCRPVICPVQQIDRPTEPFTGAGYRAIRSLTDTNPGVGCQWLGVENNGSYPAQCRPGLYTDIIPEATAFGWGQQEWVDWSESCDCPDSYIGTECKQVKSPQINGAANCPAGKIYDGNIFNPDRKRNSAECFFDHQVVVLNQYVEFRHHRLDVDIVFNEDTRQVEGFEFELFTRLVPDGAAGNPLLANRCTNMNSVKCELSSCTNKQVNGKLEIRCSESTCGGLKTCDGCNDISLCKDFDSGVICPLYLLQAILGSTGNTEGTIALRVDESDYRSGEIRGAILIFLDQVELGITCRTGYCADRPEGCAPEAKYLCEEGCYFEDQCLFLGLDGNETIPFSNAGEVQASLIVTNGLAGLILLLCFLVTMKLSSDRKRWVRESVEARRQQMEEAAATSEAKRRSSSFSIQSQQSTLAAGISSVPETATIHKFDAGSHPRSDTLLETGLETKPAIPYELQTGVVCDSVGYTLAERKYSPFKSCMRKPKTILSSCTAFFEPGTLTAVLGPSGAGKSTLLDILFGRPKKGCIKGKVKTTRQNDKGRWYTTSIRHRDIAYIRQDDHLMTTETVFECIWFAAQMRLSSKLPKSEKLKIVMDIMTTLQIDHIANSLVGSSDLGGISGGERRRVASAVELIANPSVIIADEPTSGLDSSSASILIKVLEEQSRLQATVICSIHQPSPRLIRRFTHSLLLTRSGGVAYYGPTQNMLPYLQTLPEYNFHVGSQLREDSNSVSETASETSETIKHVTSNGSDAGDSQSGSAPHATTSSSLLSVVRGPSQSLWSTGGNMAAVPANLNYAPVSNIADTAIEFVSRIGVKGATRTHLYWVNTSAHSKIQEQISQATQNATKEELQLEKHNAKGKFRPSSLFHFAMLTERGFRSIVRHPSVMFFQYSITGAVAVLVSTTAGKLDRDLQGAQTMVFLVLFFILFFSIMGMSSVGTIISDLHVFAREKQANMYGTLPFLVSKLVCDFIPLRILPAIVFSAVSYWTMGLWPAISIFAQYTATIVLVSLVSTLLCFFLSAVAMTVALTNLMVSAIIMWCFVFSGGLVLTEYGLLLRYTSYFYYAWEIIVANEYKQGTYKFNPEGVTLLDGIEREGTDITHQLELDPSRIGLDFSILAAWAGGLVLLSYLVLRCRSFAS